MAVEHEQSSLTADGTEQDLGAEITAAGTFQLYIDLDNMVNGDVIELRVKIKIASGGSFITLFNRSYAHDHGDPAVSEVLQVSLPVTHIHGAQFTLHQVNGTNRSFDYQIVQLDAATV